MAKYEVIHPVLHLAAGEILQPGAIFESDKDEALVLATGCFKKLGKNSEGGNLTSTTAGNIAPAVVKPVTNNKAAAGNKAVTGKAGA